MDYKYYGIIPAPLPWVNTVPEVSPKYLPTPSFNTRYHFTIDNLYPELGIKVLLSDGKIFEYKGISGMVVDNKNRINGWEDITSHIKTLIKDNKMDKEQIDNFLMDLFSIIEDHGVKVDVALQFGVSGTRVKPCGNLAFGSFLKDLCSCGCKLRTDNEFIWCSGINCDFFKTLD